MEKIPIPPLSEQHRIVNIFQEAEQTRHLHAIAQTKNAELVPAIFYSMFFEELTARDNHRVALKDFCLDADDIQCGPFGTQLQQDEFEREGVPLWGIKHVNSNFLTDTEEFLSVGKAKELEKYSLSPGDIAATSLEIESIALEYLVLSTHLVPAGIKAL